MCFAFLGATDTHSEYVILIAFAQQQWLHERTSALRLYIYCLVAFERVYSYNSMVVNGYASCICRVPKFVVALLLETYL